MVATDLHKPTFKSTLFEAVAFRLRRNYLFIFSLFFGAWWLKLTMHPVHTSSWIEIYRRMAVGSIPPSIVLGVQVGFFLCLIVIVGFVSTSRSGATQDEIHGLEPKRRRWRF
jgi:uncharacterized membrane protein